MENLIKIAFVLAIVIGTYIFFTRSKNSVAPQNYVPWYLDYNAPVRNNGGAVIPNNAGGYLGNAVDDCTICSIFPAKRL